MQESTPSNSTSFKRVPFLRFNEQGVAEVKYMYVPVSMLAKEE